MATIVTVAEHEVAGAGSGSSGSWRWGWTGVPGVHRLARSVVPPEDAGGFDRDAKPEAKAPPDPAAPAAPAMSVALPPPGKLQAVGIQNRAGKLLRAAHRGQRGRRDRAELRPPDRNPAPCSRGRPRGPRHPRPARQEADLLIVLDSSEVGTARLDLRPPPAGRWPWPATPPTGNRKSPLTSPS